MRAEFPTNGRGTGGRTPPCTPNFKNSSFCWKFPHFCLHHPPTPPPLFLSCPPYLFHVLPTTY